MSETVRERVLDLLERERSGKSASRQRGLHSNCGLGMPYWDLREKAGVRGPIGRLRLRIVVKKAEQEGLVRRFTTYDSAANVGQVVERTEVPRPAA